MASLNAGPEYYAAEEQYRQAKTYEDKMAALQEMLKFCPKHKAAHSILMDIRNRISDLRKEHAKEQRKKAARRGHGDFIKRQGAAQVCLLGFPNAGKTALFNALTGLRHASTLVPFESSVAIPGMLLVESVDLQVLDLPSATEQNKALLFTFARNADLNIVLLDPFQDLGQQKKFFADVPKAWFVSPKKGLASSGSFDFFSFDSFSPESILGFKKLLLQKLDLIRVYTKSPHGDVDRNKPFVIQKGATVLDIARQIHKELFHNLKFARVWGSAKFAGQQVSGDYALQDGDVLELHMK